MKSVERNYVIRRATEQDMMLYFEWANDPDVRRNSFNQEPIALENHKQWFQKKLFDTNTFLYVLEQNGTPAGQIRFDVYTQTNQTIAEIGFSVAAEFRGRGLSLVLLTTGVEHFVQDAPTPLIVQGAVKPENTASNKAFLSAGFHQESKELSQQSVYYYYKYFA